MLRAASSLHRRVMTPQYRTSAVPPDENRGFLGRATEQCRRPGTVPPPRGNCPALETHLHADAEDARAHVLRYLVEGRRQNVVVPDEHRVRVQHVEHVAGD